MSALNVFAARICSMQVQAQPLLAYEIRSCGGSVIRLHATPMCMPHVYGVSEFIYVPIPTSAGQPCATVHAIVPDADLVGSTLSSDVHA